MSFITVQNRLRSRAAANSASQDIPLLDARNVNFHYALLPKTTVLKLSKTSENALFLTRMGY
jgi:hypothetical protein